MADLNSLSDEQLQDIAEGKMDSLPDDVLQKIAGDESAPAPAPEKPRSLFNTDLPFPTPFGTITANPQQVAHTVKNLGLEGGGATLGQVAGAPFAEFGGVQAGGAIGGALGNIAGQLTTPGKKFSLGEVGGAAVGGAIPGASLAKAGARTVAMQGAKYAAGNVAAVNTQSMIDTGKPASLGQDAVAAVGGFAGAGLSKFIDTGRAAQAVADKTSRDSFNRETLKIGRDLGYTVPPSIVNPNAVNNSLESLGGKAAVAQSAIHMNQPKTDAAIAAQIGLPDNAPISPVSINTMRAEPNLVYDAVNKSSPQASGLLKSFKDSMDLAREAFTDYRASKMAGTPNNALLAKAKQAAADADVYKQGLKSVLPVPLFDKFDGARVKLAEIGMAERAFSGGNFDASVIGDAFAHGEKLTGNLYKIGRFEDRFGKYLRKAINTPTPGVDNLKLMMKFGGAGAGIASGHPLLGIAAPVAVAAGESAARKGVLTPFYQKKLASPFYGQTNAEDFAAALARYSAMNQSRQN
jgi:hypothetical protein